VAPALDPTTFSVHGRPSNAYARAKLAHPKNQNPKFNIAFQAQIREFFKHDIIGARHMCLSPKDRGRNHCADSTPTRFATVNCPQNTNRRAPQMYASIQHFLSLAFFAQKRGRTAFARAGIYCQAHRRAPKPLSANRCEMR
jgi:hypothetical protein